jgi:hypothetical protein
LVYCRTTCCCPPISFCRNTTADSALALRGWGTVTTTWPSRSGATRLPLGPRARGRGDNYSTIATTTPHSSGGLDGSSRLYTRGLMPHTNDREFEGWPIEGFDSRSRTPERGAVRDGPQRPKPGRTSAAGILNCVRVLMEKMVMVFPPTERRQAVESNRMDSVTRWLHYQDFEVDHQLIHSEPDEWGSEASLELTGMQLTGAEARPARKPSTSPNPSFPTKRMRDGDTMKRETDSPTSASRCARSPKIHHPPASSGATTPPTKQCSAPKSLTLRASLRLPRGLGGYIRRMRSHTPIENTENNTNAKPTQLSLSATP